MDCLNVFSSCEHQSKCVQFVFVLCSESVFLVFCYQCVFVLFSFVCVRSAIKFSQESLRTPTLICDFLVLICFLRCSCTLSFHGTFSRVKCRPPAHNATPRRRRRCVRRCPKDPTQWGPCRSCSPANRPLAGGAISAQTLEVEGRMEIRSRSTPNPPDQFAPKGGTASLAPEVPAVEIWDVHVFCP